MLLGASLLNTHQYKVWIKGQKNNTGTGVVFSPTLLCSGYWKGSLRVTLDLGRPTYIHVYSRLSNDSQVKQFRVGPKQFVYEMLQWSIKCSEFEHTSRTDEDRTRPNDCRGKLNIAERLAEFTRATLFQLSNKSVAEPNFGTNYVPFYILHQWEGERDR